MSQYIAVYYHIGDMISCHFFQGFKLVQRLYVRINPESLRFLQQDQNIIIQEGIFPTLSL